jgi:type IV pilus assembly protein PilP
MTAALLALIAASACSNSGNAPRKKAPAPHKPVNQPISHATTTAAPAQPQPVYTYNPIGKRDPFAPLITKSETKTIMARPPLERFNVNEFKLTGIVWGGFGYNAMLESPDGKGYFVHVGTIIGPNRGVVKKITKQTMVVEEKYKTLSGAINRKEIILELRKTQEGMQ